jgi:hypothetical protein
MTSRERAAFARAARWLRGKVDGRTPNQTPETWEAKCESIRLTHWNGPGETTWAAEIAESLSLDGARVP